MRTHTHNTLAPKTLAVLAKTKPLLAAALAGGVLCGAAGSALVYRKWAKKRAAAALLASTLAIAAPSFAALTETNVQQYANSLQVAANGQNIGQLARLLSDDLIVSLSRQGVGSSTLDKSAYLDMLQKSWTKAQNYHYTITIDSIAVTGDTARATFTTKETWTENGKPVSLTTNAKATLGVASGNTVLLKSIAQVSNTP